MLSVGVLAAGDEWYYLALAEEGVAARVDEYYLTGGQRPGSWVGAGSSSLGLVGPVAAADLRAVLAGRHPATGAALGSPAATRQRRPGLYLTFSAPKGVSLLGLVTDEPIAAGVRAAHDAAVADALGYLEREALFARRGRHGASRIPTGGFVAAAFGHTTSRAGDPQVHTHVLVANVVQGVDGGWSAPDSRSLFRHARTAGYLYQAALRRRLSLQFGLAWGPVQSGMAEPAGIPPAILRAFSTRRRQIEDHLERHGDHSRAAAQRAAHATRAPKDLAADEAVLAESWRVQAERLDFGPTRFAGLVGPGRLPRNLEQPEALLDRLVGPEGLTRNASSFDRRDLLRALAESAADGAAPDELEALADRLVGDRRVVALASVEPAVPGEARWTTAELLATEQDLVDSALRRGSEAPRVRPELVAAAMAARPALSGEQRQAVEALTGAPGGVAVLVGRAGAGKTFTLDACRAAWQAAGMAVVGAAPSARAAAELQAGSGIPSATLARLLADADRPGPQGGLPAGGVVVVDEAGMAGTRTLHRLLSAAARQQAKVVLVGDPAQLPAIEAGGALAGLVERLGAVELTANRRQHTEWERAALDQLRSGKAVDALTLYREHHRLQLYSTAPDAHQVLVADWWRARQAGVDAAMYALRRHDVDSLNRLARAAMASTGQLGTDELVVGQRSFAVGDQVVALRNDRRLGLLNGTRATVAAIDPASRSLSLALPDGAARCATSNYLDAGHLGYGYCLTIHKAQGVTVDAAFLLGSDALYREAGYVGLSRGRLSNALYVVAADEDQLEAAHTHGRAERHFERTAAAGTQNAGVDPAGASPATVAVLARRLGVSRAQTLALDTATPAPTQPGLAELAELRHRVLELPAGPTRTAQLAAVDRAVDEHESLLARAALADPPRYLLDRLGPPPPAGLARARWAQAARAVESYRDRYRIRAADALGAEPVDNWARLAYDHANQLIELARPMPARRAERDLGVSR